jgi:hypothetical protein
VIVNVGLVPTLVTDAVAHVHAGARRAGRDPSAIDLWTMVRANVTDDVAAGIDEIKIELASRLSLHARRQARAICVGRCDWARSEGLSTRRA